MATKKVSAKKTSAKKQPAPAKKVVKHDNGEPKFPYTTEPKALGRLLTEIPKRPKPPKVSFETLKSWNVSNNTNARTAIAVLKKLGLLGAGGEPLDSYARFMLTNEGPGELAKHIREVYRVLFENNHAPQNESNDELKKLFNIHSGGGEDALRLQLQTFKTLCDHANFDAAGLGATGGSAQPNSSGIATGQSADEQQMPPVQIALHIHLPENKSTRDYEAIIQDIAKYIYGRDISAS